VRLITEEQKRRKEAEDRAALEDFYRRVNIGSKMAREEDKQNNTSRMHSPTSRVVRPLSSDADHTPTTQPSTSTIQQTTQPTEEQILSAAKTLQSYYRARKSLSTISALESKFHTLKCAFVMPHKIDFLSPSGGKVITVLSEPNTIASNNNVSEEKEARLAYTPTNVPVRLYDEELNRILAALDSVQSWGVKGVRERRKRVVKAVEEEAGRVERIWEGVWKGYLEKEVDMAVDISPSKETVAEGSPPSVDVEEASIALSNLEEVISTEGEKETEIVVDTPSTSTLATNGPDVVDQDGVNTVHPIFGSTLSSPAPAEQEVPTTAAFPSDSGDVSSTEVEETPIVDLEKAEDGDSDGDSGYESVGDWDEKEEVEFVLL